jgi:hypothetical protein
MAYNFLGLVNDVNRLVNEVELDASNFASATGFYSTAKLAINSAVRQINFMQFEWPFNHAEQEETLVPGSTRYSFPNDLKIPDMDTFRIKKNGTLGNATSRLHLLAYEEYLDKFVDQEYDDTSVGRGIPRYVFRTPDNGYGFVPNPDKEYELVYEYFRLPIDLVNATDIPTIPENFRSIIVDGAMVYAYLFRGNTQDAALMDQSFKAGIRDMRTIYINRYDYVRSTMVQRPSTSGEFARL